MAAPIIPWQTSNIPSEIQAELNRRKVNRSFNYLGNQTANWDANTGDWNTYRGPMVSWIRACSNGAGRVDSKGNPIKPRFVLHGGKGFYETYGFSQKTAGGGNEQVIGYTPDKVPHVIQNSLVTAGANHPINVATPEISRIEVVVQKELFRRATIEWVCFSTAQLEYMTPYFLIPGLTVMIEWGWNHFNPTSLVPLHDVNFMQQTWANSYPLYTDNILRSKGNYDVIYGIISNFNWSVEGNKIVCSTEITSKDRLYAGIVKDSSLNVKSSNPSEADGVFQSIKSFLEKDDTIQNIKTIAAARVPLQEVIAISAKNSENAIWGDIFRPILENKNPEVYSMKSAYVHGVFSGRSKDQYADVGKPDNNDFDYSSAGNDGDKLWINMGLVVEILNYFSALPGGKGKPMFSVDIMNTVISGHPNLISCDPRVLIPNAQAPKFHYGAIGMRDYGQTNSGGSDYQNQIAIGKPVPKGSGNKADEQLGKLFTQFALSGGRNIFRSNLDKLINRYRYQNIRIRQPLSSWSFPSSEDYQFQPLPNSTNGMNGNYLEKDRSGLLSNVYISFNAFKQSVEKGISSQTATYVDIYKDILQLLMDSTDGFWDLELVEVENNMTITDKRYIGPKPISVQGDSVFSFEYYDSDSLIKGLKFRPQLSDAQATRTIFGETNNKASKYTTFDKNDMLDYKFRDAVIFNPKEREQDDASSDISRRSAASAREQIRSMVSKVQQINVSGDSALQMSIVVEKSTAFVAPSTSGVFLPATNVQSEKREIFKLILPDQQLLRMLLDDKDEDNNPRYCAVQPGIVLEITLSGIGGIRTFQYFLVKNLPEPYSEKNIIFRVVDVHQTLESGNWDTVIRAQPIPLRKYIKNRLRGPWSSQTPS